MTTRKFYCFNDEEIVEDYISKIKTTEDLKQLEYDLDTSTTNLTKLIQIGDVKLHYDGSKSNLQNK